MPIAYRLQEEGCDIVVGQVQDLAELGIDKTEDAETKKQRLTQYNGMLKKYPARKLVDSLKKMKSKDDFFILCDQNELFAYAEELLAAGFTKGLFPLKEDFEMEKEREEAMEFVETNYAKIKVIPHQKVKTVEEAKKLIESADYPMVLQSEGDYASTVCPGDDVEQNHTEIISALEKNKSLYEKGEIILKEKLIQPIEITPQIVFWNGKRVFTDIDIETKTIGDGEGNGNQVGCASNLVVATTEEDLINELAFPPIIQAMAKKRKGLFVWDISLYLTEKGVYFGEFCPNRFGYDSLMTEISMAGGAKVFFEALVSVQEPLGSKFGAGLRVFNLNRSKDQVITMTRPDETWLYEVKKDRDELVSVGDCWDLGVVTGSGDTFDEAVDAVYENLETLSFKEKYTRTKEDFLADYPTSILHRYRAVNGMLFDAPDLAGSEGETKEYKKNIEVAVATLKQDHEGALKDLEKKHQKEMKAIRDEIKDILNS